MKIFADLLREVKEPPVVEIGGKSYTGRILSHEQFLVHEEALYLTQVHAENADDSDALRISREQLTIALNFLRDVFPEPPIPRKPKEPRAHNILEKLWYWLSGKDPKRWHNYVDALDKWEEEVAAIKKDDPVLLIMASPALFEILAQLFISQRTALMGTAAVTNTKNEPSKVDSSKSPSEQSEQPTTNQEQPK